MSMPIRRAAVWSWPTARMEDPVRVRKLQGAGDYYKVSWNGRTLVLSKVKSHP